MPFEGTGLVEFGNNDGNGIGGYSVTNQTAVPHVATAVFRYAAGYYDVAGVVGPADRTLTARLTDSTGAVTETDVVFAQLGSTPGVAPFGWEVWGDQTFSFLVAPGETVDLELVLDSARGNTGGVNIDWIEISSCVASTNLQPKIEVIDDVEIWSNGTVDITFEVADPNAGDTLTVRAVGLPAGLTLTKVGGNKWQISGTPGPGFAEYPITLMVTDDGSPALSATSALTITVDWFDRSPWADRIVFTEVVKVIDPAPSSGDATIQSPLGPIKAPATGNIPDENIEIRNIWTNGNIDLEDWKLYNYHPGLGPDPGQTDAFNYTFPPDGYFGEPHLTPGGRALITVRDPSDFSGSASALGTTTTYNLGTDPWTDTQDQQFALLGPGEQYDLLNDLAAHLWLMDPSGRLAAYVAWGTAGQGSLLTEGPAAVHNLWDDQKQASLSGGAPAQSIALATDGPEAWNSACWEFNTSTTVINSGNCSAPSAATVNNDPVRTVEFPTGSGAIHDFSDVFPSRNTSIGAANNDPPLPLPNNP